MTYYGRLIIFENTRGNKAHDLVFRYIIIGCRSTFHCFGFLRRALKQARWGEGGWGIGEEKHPQSMPLFRLMCWGHLNSMIDNSPKYIKFGWLSSSISCPFQIHIRLQLCNVWCCACCCCRQCDAKLQVTI